MIDTEETVIDMMGAMVTISLIMGMIDVAVVVDVAGKIVAVDHGTKDKRPQDDGFRTIILRLFTY